MAVSRRSTCPVCYRFSAPTFRSVLTHIGSVHSWEPNFSLTCGIEGCPRIYTSYRSYRKHLLLKHAEFMNGPLDDHADSANYLDSADYFDEAQDDTTLPASSSRTMDSLALFILKAKEERRIPQQALDGLLDDFHEISKIQINALGESVMKCLEELNCTSSVISAVDKVINGAAASSPFDGLHTAYLQQEYFKKLP